MSDNKLFLANISSSTIGSTYSTRKSKVNRVYLLSRDTANELNTYRMWYPFRSNSESHQIKYTVNGSKVKEERISPHPWGVRSLFNRAGAVLLGNVKDIPRTTGDNQDNTNFEDLYSINSVKNLFLDSPWLEHSSNWRIGLNAPLMENPEIRTRIRANSGCTVKELVEASSIGALGREIYSYADFMYCKHLGKMPNNHLITLRRFPIPVDDFIGSTGAGVERKDKSLKSQNMQSIGCMVTWLGTPGNEWSNILKYSVNMPFQEKTAKWEQGGGGADQGTGVLNSIAAAMDPAYRKAYTAGYGGTAFNAYIGKSFGCDREGPNPMGVVDANKVYGPVDAIKTTYMRSEDGLKFDQKITLVFEYELRSYDGINGRQAMLDLLSNILNVTYSTGTFWGGGYRGGGMHQNNIFANLKTFKCHGGFTDFVDAMQADYQTISGQVKQKVADAGGGLEGIINLAKQALNALGGMIIGGALNKLGRPARGAANSLLSPAPVGFWHITIGNPHHPIMSLGNMILKNTTIEHTGPLGLDDFPTGLKVTCELDRGKARDITGIEAMYMKGQERIYSSMSQRIFEMYSHAKIAGDSEIAKKYYADLSKDDQDLPVAPAVNPLGKLKDDEADNENKTTNKSTTANKDENDKDKKTKPEEIPEYESQVTFLETSDITMLQKTKDIIQKYFGETDAYSIYFAAAEQEKGATRKHKKESSTKQDTASGDNNATDKNKAQSTTTAKKKGKK